MELVVKFSAKMLFDDFCLKIYFWPFLSYLANMKGVCPIYPAPPGPPSPLPPIPTYQPTPPTTTTLAPCPAMPLVCQADGSRPIPYCPCIDPRQQMASSQAITNQALISAPLLTNQAYISQQPTLGYQQYVVSPSLVLSQPLDTQQQYAVISSPVLNQFSAGQQQQFSSPVPAISQHLVKQDVITDQQPVAQTPISQDQPKADPVTIHQMIMNHPSSSPSTAMTAEQLAILQQQMADQNKPMTTDELVEVLDLQSLEFKNAKATNNQGASEMMIFSHLPETQTAKRR
ncbi:uncharacterized protein LOC142233729 [Haematobia irritans]|uniref:uncharacterized protein LOC142233729 n=1 Tax=Haematobia irritans TaxID=7368 RepID=UPI003F50D075